MNKPESINDALHQSQTVKKGDFFLEYGKPCTKIGKLEKGIMRGFIYDSTQGEITTHFYQEGDLIIGSFVPNVNLTTNIQALEDCEMTIAKYAEVMSHVNKDPEITQVINREFQKLNKQMQSRLVSLLNLDSLKKYELFLNDYPGLINRIPHYYIAQYLGITPTQLSRARKQFSQQM